MSTSVPTLALQSYDISRRKHTRTFKLTFAAGDYATNGIPLDLSSIVTNPNNLERAKFARNPTGFRVLNHPQGYELVIVPGSAIGTGWLAMLFVTGAGNGQVLAELAAGALAAGIVADTGIRVAFETPLL